MAPAFSSRRQALALALLLTVLLALPALMAKTGWLSRRDVYPAIPWKLGPFSWIQREIFDQSGDVDIAFVGSSHLWAGIDASYVREKLTEQIGRQAEVFTLGWPWPGFDAVYVVAHDLLNHRRVRTLVVYDEARDDDLPHIHSQRWFRIGEDSEVFEGLPWLSRANLYGGAVLAMPRQLLSAIRPNLTEDPFHTRPNYWSSYYRAPNIAQNWGSLRARIGFGYNPNFVFFVPPVQAGPSDAQVYSAESREAFEFPGPATKPYSLRFARSLARLCQEHGTQLVVIHMPSLNEFGKTRISERRIWSEEWGAPAEILGIAPARLFAGISESEVRKLYYDSDHFNLNGQEVFTPLITPALLRLYGTFTSRDR